MNHSVNEHPHLKLSIRTHRCVFLYIVFTFDSTKKKTMTTIESFVSFTQCCMTVCLVVNGNAMRNCKNSFKFFGVKNLHRLRMKNCKNNNRLIVLRYCSRLIILQPRTRARETKYMKILNFHMN